MKVSKSSTSPDLNKSYKVPPSKCHCRDICDYPSLDRQDQFMSGDAFLLHTDCALSSELRLYIIIDKLYCVSPCHIKPIHKYAALPWGSSCLNRLVSSKM